MKYILSILISFLLHHQYADCQQHSSSRKENGNATILGHITNSKPGDSMSLFLYGKNTISEAEAHLLPPVRLVSEIKDGRFTFHLTDLSSIQYFYLIQNAQKIFDNPGGRKLISYIIEPGDNIGIQFDSSFVKFAGKGKEKYQAKHAVDSIYNTLIYAEDPPQTRNIIETTKRSFQKAVTIQNSLFRELQKKLKIRSTVYSIMYADIIGKTQWDPLSLSLTGLMMGTMDKDKDYPIIHTYVKDYCITVKNIPEVILALSKEYTDYLYIKEQVDYLLCGRDKHYLQRFAEKFKGLTRDKLLTKTLIQGYVYIPKIDSALNNAILFIENDSYKTALRSFHESQKVGRPAFDFSLRNTAGQTIRLSDFAGKVVFMDFWYVGCGPCISYFEEAVSKTEKEFYGDTNVVFISVAIEKKENKWMEAVNSGLYTSPEIINVYTGESGYENPVVKHYYITACPKPLLIDKEGNIFSSNANSLGHGMRGNPDRLIGMINAALNK